MLPKEQFIYFTAVIAITFFLLAAFFILVIIFNVRKRKQKEVEALNAVIDMQESERKRIANDMHDQVGPMLSAIKLKINSIKQIKDLTEIDYIIRESTSNMDTLIQDIRQVVRNLSPTMLSKYGLIQTIEDFKNVIERNNEIQFEFFHDGLYARMSEKAEINIYRIVAELINNSLKHSGCTLIKLTMKMHVKKTTITYTDNGINSNSDSVSSSGMGLKSIESRVNSFNGKLIFKGNFSGGANYQIIFDNYILMKPNE